MASSVAINISTGAAWTDGVINVTYNYAGDAASRASRNATGGLTNISKWQPTFGTVIAAAVIVSLVMGVMLVWFTKRKGAY